MYTGFIDSYGFDKSKFSGLIRVESSKNHCLVMFSIPHQIRWSQ
jgi:hypothetical protein